MQALQARIRQLESDNASLTAAAEQASQLVEELAADASKYRAGAHQSLIEELKDAALRKDRRIQRLTEQLSIEREQNVLLQNRVTQLEELKQVSDDIEETLKGCINVLQEKVQYYDSMPFEDGRHEMSLRKILLPLLQDDLMKSILTTVERFFPPSVSLASDFSLFRVTLQSRTILAVTELLRIELNQKHGPLSHISDLLRQAGKAAQHCTIWIFKDAEKMLQRAEETKQAIEELERRTLVLYIEVESFDSATQWTQEFTKMKTELLNAAVETLNSLLPKEGFHVVTTKPLDLSHCLLTAYELRGIMIAKKLDSVEQGHAHDSQVSELKSKLEVGKTMLSQRSKELEELRVRNEIFEDRIKKAAEDAGQISSLNEKVQSLTLELNQACQNSNLDTTNKDEPDFHGVQTRGYSSSPKKKKDEAIPVSEKRKREYEVSRLRKTIIQLQLADLQPATLPTDINESKYDEMIHARKTLSVVLQSAREAASNARVLKLDRESLQPKSRGATLSRKPLLQSLALSTRISANTHIQQFERKYVEMKEATFETSPTNVKSVIELFQSSVSS